MKKAPVYAVAQLTIHDRARYEAYVRRFPPVLARFGGQLLAADEAPAVIEGSWDRQKVVLLRFDDERSFEAWAQSPDYREIALDRQAGAEGPVLLVHGLPAAARGPRYDVIGPGYARVRREDPEIRRRIHAALGDARTVVNVGAGAGSYEPRDRYVVAIEPSKVMAEQRPRDLAPAIRASADDLPLGDGSVDAAMAILAMHHWDEAQERGIRELRRVARGPVVVLTYDPRVSGEMWLLRDYLREVAELDQAIFPPPEQLARWLGGNVDTEAVPLSRETPDWMLGSYWAHPERVLDADARAATSGFALMPREVVERVVAKLARDLDDGTWERNHVELHGLDTLDVGLRLITARPHAESTA